MDILLGEFYNKNYLDFSNKDLLALEKFIISLPDDKLYKCFIGKENWPSELSIKLLNKLNIYSKKIGLKNS